MRRALAPVVATLIPIGAVLLQIAAAPPASAQFAGVTLPPSGDNQRATVTQSIGLVKVSVDYSSPDVHAPDGSDRRGKIWGDLVPFGMADLGFGSCGKECPWRGGANENTVFTVSHDVKVQGKPLPAGRYGLHFVAGTEEWTVIFSNNSTSWGSYTYDAREDALRVTAKPAKSDYHEWLTYEFTDRRPEKATLALAWEDLALPIEITVDDPTALYVANLRRELRSSAGFSSQGWLAAARYCLQNKVNLVEAETWAERAAHDPFAGKETFETLALLSDLQGANGKTGLAKKSIDTALAHPTAGPIDIHAYGRRLMREGKNREALAIFQLNAKRFPNQWPVNVGLARGYSATGDLKKALEHAKTALGQAPDEGNKKALEKAIELLSQGKPWN